RDDGQGRRAAGNSRHAGPPGLQLEPMHGWGITERIEQWSESVLQLGQGTLSPALYRLERKGLIRSDWRLTENNRRAGTTRSRLLEGVAWSTSSRSRVVCREP
ncbi:MAG: helix-turn-helix transcriptional regulator, partial [Steroidobacter sp.]